MNRALIFVLLGLGCGTATVSQTGSDAGATDAGAASSFDAGSCQVAPAFAAGDLVGKAGFDLGGPMSPPFNFATMRRQSAVMFNEFFAAAPLTNVAIPAQNYERCQYCFVIQTNCDSAGANCSKRYLAQSGTLTVSAASKDVDAGSYAFVLSNVKYQAWDFVADGPLDGGCLALENFVFMGAWP